MTVNSIFYKNQRFDLDKVGQPIKSVEYAIDLTKATSSDMIFKLIDLAFNGGDNHFAIPYRRDISGSGYDMWYLAKYQRTDGEEWTIIKFQDRWTAKWGLLFTRSDRAKFTNGGGTA